MLKLPMAVIAVSASLSLSHAFNSVNELCQTFATKMSNQYGENALREMSLKSHDFEGYRFVDPHITTNNQSMATMDYDPISKIEGVVNIVHDDAQSASVPDGSNYGVCKFSALSVDNPTPGMKTMTLFDLGYYKLKRKRN